jgi:5,6-dimethylbenzimidazole synthase
MALYDAIKGRRDIRSYFKPYPIPDEVLAKILLAAHLAHQ